MRQTRDCENGSRDNTMGLIIPEDRPRGILIDGNNAPCDRGILCRAEDVWREAVLRPWATPIPPDKVTFNVNPFFIPAAVVDSLMISKAARAHWKIEGRRATALEGATLSGLAKAVTGDPND